MKTELFIPKLSLHSKTCYQSRQGVKLYFSSSLLFYPKLYAPCDREILTQGSLTITLRPYFFLLFFSFLVILFLCSIRLSNLSM